MIKYAKKLQEKRKRVVAHVSVETYDNLIKLSIILIISILSSYPLLTGGIKTKYDLLVSKDKTFSEIQARTGIRELSSINKYVEDISTRLKGTAESIKNKVARGIKLDPEKQFQIERRYQTIESARANVVQGILNAKERLQNIQLS